MQAKVNSRGVRIVRVAWIIAMTAVLILWLSAVRDLSSQHDDAHLYFVLILVVLSFPSGLAWVALANVTSYVAFSMGYRLELPPAAEISALWTGFLLVGYLQWFVLLPVVYRRFRVGFRSP